jgi:hypothetical protein
MMELWPDAIVARMEVDHEPDSFEKGNRGKDLFSFEKGAMTSYLLPALQTILSLCLSLSSL